MSAPMRPNYRKWQKAPDGKKPFQCALFFRDQKGRTVEIAADAVSETGQSVATFLLTVLSVDITAGPLSTCLPRFKVEEGWADAGQKGTRVGPDVPINGILWMPILWDGEEDPGWFESRGLVPCED